MAALACKNCGAEAAPDSIFCYSCGSRIEPESATEPEPVTKPETVTETEPATEQPATEPKEELPPEEQPVYAEHTDAPPPPKTPGENLFSKLIAALKAKKLLIPIGAGILAVAAIITAVIILSPGKYETASGSLFIEGFGNEVIIIPSGRQKIELSGYLQDIAINMDGTRGAVLINEGDGYGNVLYYVADRHQLISYDVHDFWMSPNGSAVAYTKDIDRSAGTAELYLYTGGASERITSDFSINDNVCVLSPDGKTLAYVTADEDDYTGVVWNGEAEVLGKDLYPFAVSNGARYVYYYSDRNDAYFVQRGLNSDSREKLCNDMYSWYLNKDATQILYESDSGANISVNGGGKQSLAGSIWRLIVPDGTAHFDITSRGSLYGLSSFAGTFYIEDINSSIVYISNRYDSSRVARNVESDNVYLADDGKTLTYLRGSSIYTVDGTRGDNAEPYEIVSREVKSFVATSDGRAVYYVTNDDEIYYMRGNSSPVIVTNYFDNDYWYMSYGLFRGRMLFYIEDEVLYVSNRNRGVSVRGIEGNVQAIDTETYRNSIYIMTEDGRDLLLYRSTDGSTFEKIYEG